MKFVTNLRNDCVPALYNPKNDKHSFVDLRNCPDFAYIIDKENRVIAFTGISTRGGSTVNYAEEIIHTIGKRENLNLLYIAERYTVYDIQTHLGYRGKHAGFYGVDKLKMSKKGRNLSVTEWEELLDVHFSQCTPIHNLKDKFQGAFYSHVIWPNSDKPEDEWLDVHQELVARIKEINKTSIPETKGAIMKHFHPLFTGILSIESLDSSFGFEGATARRYD